MYRIPDHEERLRFLVQQVERITGLQNFGVYMNKLLTIDAFFLNEDGYVMQKLQKVIQQKICVK